MVKMSLEVLDRLLIRESGYVQEVSETQAARRLQRVRVNLLEHLREVTHSADLSLIVATERAIVEGDKERYANSPAMASSLKTALNEIAVIERHIGIVGDPDRYRMIDEDKQPSKKPQRRPAVRRSA